MPTAEEILAVKNRISALRETVKMKVDAYSKLRPEYERFEEELRDRVAEIGENCADAVDQFSYYETELPKLQNIANSVVGLSTNLEPLANHFDHVLRRMDQGDIGLPKLERLDFGQAQVEAVGRQLKLLRDLDLQGFVDRRLDLMKGWQSTLTRSRSTFSERVEQVRAVLKQGENLLVSLEKKAGEFGDNVEDLAESAVDEATSIVGEVQELGDELLENIMDGATEVGDKLALFREQLVDAFETMEEIRVAVSEGLDSASSGTADSTDTLETSTELIYSIG